MNYRATEETPVATGTVSQVTVIRGHVSPETAYGVDDYPYGSLRCQIRYWLDTAVKGAKKGQTRFVSQTANPKKPYLYWNNPKPSTYVEWAFMYLDSGNRPSGKQHVHWSGTGVWVRPAYSSWLRLSGAYGQLRPEERADFDLFEKVSKARDAGSLEHWNKAVGYAVDHYTEHGTWPSWPEFEQAPGFYASVWEYPTAVAEAASRLAVTAQ